MKIGFLIILASGHTKSMQTSYMVSVPIKYYPMSIKVPKIDIITKRKIMTTLQKLPKNVGDLGKILSACMLIRIHPI